MALSPNQLAHLKSISDQAGFIPAITFSALSRDGLAEKTPRPEGVVSAGRGKTYAIATPLGIKAAQG